MHLQRRASGEAVQSPTKTNVTWYAARRFRMTQQSSNISRRCYSFLNTPFKLKFLAISLLFVTSIVFVVQKIALSSESRGAAGRQNIDFFQLSTGERQSFTVTNGEQKPDGHATIVVISARSDYSNDSNRLAAMLIDLVSNDCRNNPTRTNQDGSNGSGQRYLLYAVGPRGEMPATTSDIESAVVNGVASTVCSGIVVKLVADDDSPLTAKLNRAALDAYLDHEDDYFRLVFLSSLATAKPQPIAYCRSVIDDRMSPGSHGIIVELSTSPTVVIVSAFFGAAHFEVFGWLLPPNEPDIVKSIGLLVGVYNSQKMVFALRHSASSSNTSEFETTAGNSGDDVSLISVGKSHTMLPEMIETLNRYLASRSANPCWRSCEKNLTKPVNVVSMSLYGASRRYTFGAVRNAHLLPVNFPGWTLRIYHELPAKDGSTKHGTVPAFILRRLAGLGVDLRLIDVVNAESPTQRLAPMMWRFLVAVDTSVETFIVRDSDSRLTPRDASTVEDWLRQAPDAAFHCIRDHPSHSGFAVSGGLWGGRPARFAAALLAASPPVTDLVAVMQRYSSGYIADMNFLCRDIWPIVKSVAYCHDSFSCESHAASHPFPVARIGGEHIGEVYNEFSIGRDGDIRILLNARINPKCVPNAP